MYEENHTYIMQWYRMENDAWNMHGMIDPCSTCILHDTRIYHTICAHTQFSQWIWNYSDVQTYCP